MTIEIKILDGDKFLYDGSEKSKKYTVFADGDTISIVSDINKTPNLTNGTHYSNFITKGSDDSVMVDGSTSTKLEMLLSISSIVSPIGSSLGLMPFGLAVTTGNLEGNDVIDKFGRNPLITTGTDPEDIWEAGGIYDFSADGVADIVSLSSSDASDNQDITIQGLDINGALVEQTKTLNGQTRVVLDTPLWRVFRMENDGNTDLAGVVYCYSGTENTLGVPSGASVTKAIINNGNNQTLMALYTIPKGKVGFLFKGELGMNFTGAVGTGVNFLNAVYKSRRVGKVFKIKKFVSLINQANSNYTDTRDFPDPIPAFTDIVLTVEEVSADMGAWGTFCILLVDESKLSQDYLNAIGQQSTIV